MSQKRHILWMVSLMIVSSIAAFTLLTGCGGDANGGSTPPSGSGEPSIDIPSGGDVGTGSSSSVSGSATAQGEVIWTFEDNATGATLTGYEKNKGMPSGTIKIPQMSAARKIVTQIGNDAFRDAKITGIEIPSSVTSIGSYALSGCYFTHLNWPKNVKVLENHVLDTCTKLKSIYIPEGVTKIGDHALAGCLGLTAISLPESVTSIDEGAFFLCLSLETIYIPGSVTQLDESTLAGCSNLKSVYYGGNPKDLKITNKNDYTLWPDLIQSVTENPLSK